MVEDQHLVVCFRLASEYLIPREACRLILLNRYFSHHYINDAFKEAIASQLMSQLPPEIELQTELTFAQMLYMHQGFKNLLQNVSGQEDFSHWERHDGGHGWIIEDRPNFRGNQRAFVSSYEWCSLSQTIDLTAKGYSKKALNNAVFVAGEVICARSDCGAIGKVELEIGSVNSKWMSSEEIRCPEDVRFEGFFGPHTISIVDKLPEGANVVKFAAMGKDVNWWAGHYGARIVHSFLYVVPIPEGTHPEDIIKIKKAAEEKNEDERHKKEAVRKGGIKGKRRV